MNDSSIRSASARFKTAQLPVSLGMCVSPGKVFLEHVSVGDACFPAHISLGVRVSHQ